MPLAVTSPSQHWQIWNYMLHKRYVSCIHRFVSLRGRRRHCHVLFCTQASLSSSMEVFLDVDQSRCMGLHLVRRAARIMGVGVLPLDAAVARKDRQESRTKSPPHPIVEKNIETLVETWFFTMSHRRVTQHVFT